ncbi:MAG: hypothetical protein HOQ24_15940 [Mycobacteriaceae bacterium]|nr:hypothetical protein [Mycobacteriaceae bacterium]
MPAVTVAAKSNRAGTITVRATNQGMPVEVTISREELRYGAQPLADQILQLCRLATTEAGMRRRDLLSERGIPDEILNRLGLPSREPAPAGPEDDDWTPTTWLRKV